MKTAIIIKYDNAYDGLQLRHYLINDCIEEYTMPKNEIILIYDTRTIASKAIRKTYNHLKKEGYYSPDLKVDKNRTTLFWFTAMAIMDIDFI
jgi:hypothetical protein